VIKNILEPTGHAILAEFFKHNWCNNDNEIAKKIYKNIRKEKLKVKLNIKLCFIDYLNIIGVNYV
jgi:hypothetical protein